MPEIADVLAPVLPLPFTRAERVGDGREDFDFLFGTWRVANRKLTDMVDPACTDWLEFETVVTAHPILAGLGNIDSVVAQPGGPLAGFQGFTLRLFDPELRVWRIWWSSTNQPGTLDAPQEGRFGDGVGAFYGSDVVAGRDVDVVFRWEAPTPGLARWSQDFSTDHGATWWTNWVMDFTRVAP